MTGQMFRSIDEQGHQHFFRCTEVTTDDSGQSIIKGYLRSGVDGKESPCILGSDAWDRDAWTPFTPDPTLTWTVEQLSGGTWTAVDGDTTPRTKAGALDVARVALAAHLMDIGEQPGPGTYRAVVQDGGPPTVVTEADLTACLRERGHHGPVTTRTIWSLEREAFMALPQQTRQRLHQR
ncbi:hypothetical protein [Streptomyces sp. NPDC001985]|uniref:hypothetical protein n=1 Tax=Streptomyces sp. NPDC001985 TaxID=3154406 RepID=UPI00331E5C3B